MNESRTVRKATGSQTQLPPIPLFFPRPTFATSSHHAMQGRAEDGGHSQSQFNTHCFCYCFLLKTNTHSSSLWQHGAPPTGVSPPWTPLTSMEVFHGQQFSSDELYQCGSPSESQSSSGTFSHQWSLRTTRPMLQPGFLHELYKLERNGYSRVSLHLFPH